MSVRPNSKNDGASRPRHKESAGPSASLTALGKQMGMFQATPADFNLQAKATDNNDPMVRLKLARDVLFLIASAENDVKVEARKKEEAQRLSTPIPAANDPAPLLKTEPNAPAPALRSGVSKTVLERATEEQQRQSRIQSGEWP
jgi:hypothetical protein